MSLRLHPNPGIPYFTQALLIAWRGNSTPGKISHYDLLIQKVIPDYEIFTYQGKDISIPKCTTVVRARITKSNAKKLIKEGIKPTGAYFTGK